MQQGPSVTACAWCGRRALQTAPRTPTTAVITSAATASSSPTRKERPACQQTSGRANHGNSRQSTAVYGLIDSARCTVAILVESSRCAATRCVTHSPVTRHALTDTSDHCRSFAYGFRSPRPPV
eukprot:4069214-Prymnesium_polylepis.1